MNRQQGGFTLIELIMVIVILGALAVVAVPKYVDLQSQAEVASADGVYGAAQAATAINHAAKIAGVAAADRPAYDGSTCTAGLIAESASGANDAGTCLLNAFDTAPEGWSANNDTIEKTAGGTTYTITVSNDETSTDKATLQKSW
jgi:MSHA pilin protein MshA